MLQLMYIELLTANSDILNSLVPKPVAELTFYI